MAWEKIYTIRMSDKGLVSSKLLQLNNKKTDTLYL